MSRLALVLLAAAATRARADEIPIVTVTDLGPNQEIPVDRAFYLTGSADADVASAQAVIVQQGRASLFGGAGADCATVVRDLHVDTIAHSDADEDDDAPATAPRLATGVHRAFEVFPRARDVREAAVLVTASWHRGDGARQYKVLVPHDPGMFAAGRAYCMFVVTTERRQEIDDAQLGDLIDGLGKKIVGCADKTSCQSDALDDYRARVARVLATQRAVSDGPRLAARLTEDARVELGSSTGLIEARDHMQDRWAGASTVMQPAQSLWLDTQTDPFAHATAAMLARSAALLPQVKGTAVAMYTTDGKLAIGALQLLDDNRSIRVAASKSPGDRSRVLTATTDGLVIADGLTLYDLLQLGHGKIRIDREWATLESVGERVAALGLDEWTAEDTAFLTGALAQLERLQIYVEAAAAGAACGGVGIGSTEPDLTPASTNHQLGTWMTCQRVDTAALASLIQQLHDLVQEDQTWRAAKEKLLDESRRVVTVTSTAPTSLRVSFASKTWVFSYLTPIIGYAGVARTDESFGLFYLGAQLHFAPNPVDDVLWSHGVTARDLRRAVALELGVAPTGKAFGPDARFSGPGGLPPIFLGLAVHIVPYTSLSVGALLTDRKRSTLAQEDPHLAVSPYVGVTLQLNLPDLFRYASSPSSNTSAIP